MKHAVRVLKTAALGVAVSLSACESPTTQPDPYPPIEVVTDVNEYLLPVGYGVKFSATVRNASNPVVEWRSAAPGIVKVDQTGTAIGVAPGVTTISVISAQDTTRRAHIEVTVIVFPGQERFTVTPAAVDLMLGDTLTLVARDGGAVATASWQSSAPHVVSVSATGHVRALSAGSAAVTARLASDTTVRAVALIRVDAAAADTMRILGLGAVTDRYTGEVAARGDWAYTSTWGNRNGNPGNIIHVWNVSGAVPVLANRLTVPGATTTGDVQISDDGALLVVAVEHNPNGAIVIYNRSDPSKPDSIARFANASTRQGVHTVKLSRVGGRHYAFLSVNPGVQPARLVIVDITNPQNPTETWVGIMGNPFVHDVFVRDGILFTALWHGGVGIWDIGGGGAGGTPSAPVKLSQLSTLASIHNLWWFHDPTNGSRRYLFVGQEGPSSVLKNASGDLYVLDVSNLRNPFQVAHYHVPGAGAHNFWMDEPSGILYAAFYNGGVRALDVRGDLSSCTTSQRNANGFCDLWQMGREKAVAVPPNAYVWGVVHQGTHVYASDMAAGLYKLDASKLKR